MELYKSILEAYGIENMEQLKTELNVVAWITYRCIDYTVLMHI